MRDFRIDGIRLDSIENIANWDFIQEFKDHARHLWRVRWQEQHLPAVGADERFLVVGEELAVPLGLLTQNRLDGLWNEPFKRMVRHAILGKMMPMNPASNRPSVSLSTVARRDFSTERRRSIT
jgi:hypothetical protein